LPQKDRTDLAESQFHGLRKSQFPANTHFFLQFFAIPGRDSLEKLENAWLRRRLEVDTLRNSNSRLRMAWPE